jgi:hypothetical protein
MRRAGYMLLLSLCLIGALVGPAGAAPSPESASLSLSTTLAGAHADLTFSASLEEPGEPEVARDLTIGLPPGYFLYPAYHPRCDATQWEEQHCPVVSQVGIVDVRGNFDGDPDFELGTAAVRLLPQEDGEFARLGFVVPTIEAPVEVSVSAAPGDDYGLRLAFEGLPAAAPLQGLDFTLWGVPADPAHDEERFPLGPGGTPSSSPQLPLTRNPTSCGPAGSLTLSVDSYQDPGDFASISGSTPALTGCGLLPFDPSFAAGLTVGEIDTASALLFSVQIPQSLNPSALSTADSKELSVSLPYELGLDEEALADVATCSLAEADPDGEGSSHCPLASKLGLFTAEVLGPETLASGSFYFGGAASPDSYRLYLIADGGGLDLRLPALLAYDETTESWAFQLSPMPQLPFQSLSMEIASAGGPFVAPWECGDFEVAADFTPWTGSSATRVTDDLTVHSGPEGGPCPGPAEEVAVSLSPTSIPADGAATSVATATVLDANGYLLVGEEIVFESTDPGQRIGPVTDNGDGTYTAQIIASTEPGEATIFAFDETVEGEAFGFAKLTQTALPSPSTPAILSSPPPPQPVVKFRRRPPARTYDRTPSFRFLATVPGSSFECKLDRRPLRPCKSPLTLPRLGFGRHSLKVRAIAPSGLASPFASDSFVVRRR